MNNRDNWKSRIPVGEFDGLKVERFVIPERSWENLRNAFDGRGAKPGEYTRLVVDSQLWMSDTDAEYRDHISPIVEVSRPYVRKVLVNGLGLGCFLQCVLAQPHIEQVDVVELDKRVVEYMLPYFDDPRLTVHQADAYEQMREWPKGSHWDVAWHDIWPDLDEDNLEKMARLHRSYGRRTTWQGSWGKAHLQYERRRTADAWWRHR